MKKIYNKLVLITAFALMAIGCGDKLNIQPAQSVDASTALRTSKDVKGALIGAYSSMGSGNLYSGGIQVYSDLLAFNQNDLFFQGTFQELTQITDKDIPINNATVAAVWLEAYSVINVTNEVLAALSVVSPVEKDQVEGEAKFIRACMYFELVKLFGRAWNDGDPTANLGVPLILTPTHTLADAEAKPFRNTVSQVYAQIISDLNDAEAKVQPPDNVTYYFATPGAAAGMLSRVYLMQGDFVNAQAAADRVITSGYYKLTNTYGDEFPYTGRGVRIFNTTEDVFAQQVSEQSGVNNMNTFFASSDVGGRGDIEATAIYLATYEAGDARLGLFADDGSGVYFYCTKFDNVFGNIKILRLAEMYLTRAECNLRQSTSVGDAAYNAALSDLNLVRARVNLSPLGTVALADILNERHLELACEGQWISDYKRTTTSVGAFPYDSPKLVFPIPQRETIVNPNLVQNDGYN